MTRILTTEHVTAMVAAMRKVKAFEIERTRTTVVVRHPKHGVVYRALRKSSRGDAWIITHVDNLFVGAN